MGVGIGLGGVGFWLGWDVVQKLMMLGQYYLQTIPWPGLVRSTAIYVPSIGDIMMLHLISCGCSFVHVVLNFKF